MGDDAKLACIDRREWRPLVGRKREYNDIIIRRLFAVNVSSNL